MRIFHPCNLTKGKDLGEEEAEYNEGLGQQGGQGKQETEKKITRLRPAATAIYSILCLEFIQLFIVFHAYYFMHNTLLIVFYL